MRVARSVQVKQSKARRTHCAGMAATWLCPLGDSIYADVVVVTKNPNFLHDYDYKCTALQM